MPHTCADIRQAAERLGWRPKTALAEGLLEEIAWVARLEAEGAFADSP
jgi:nucleoside-diphosphate-sugar epimerase